jgi:hypothetical protein
MSSLFGIAGWSEPPCSEEGTMRKATVSQFRGGALQGTLAIALVLTATWSTPARAAQVKQQRFASAEDAAHALFAAVKTGDTKALLAVLGNDARPLINSGDPVADRTTRERFVQRYEESNSLVKTGDATMVLQVGKDNWPFPIPLVEKDGAWRFDSHAGAEEILDRRIGANEDAAIQACLAYVDAQREYYQHNPEGSTLLHYAQKIASTKGKRDGLFWETKDAEEPSPLGPAYAQARATGYREAGVAGAGSSATRNAYHGYYYKILTAQGPNAPGGAYDYVVRGQMIGGFALVAYPAVWDNSGIMTFIVNHDGVVFEKDLGPKTAAIAQKMKVFDPDNTWKRVGTDVNTATTSGQ